MIATRRDLHVCGSLRQLVMALATVAAKRCPADLVFLEDTMPAPAGLAARVREIDPDCRIHVTTDAAEIENFARLPRTFPAVLRRNLSLSKGRPIRPGHWAPAFLTERRYATGYFGHPGFFLSKCLAPKCDLAVLREDGLSNYRIRKVPPWKAVLRVAMGLPAFRQISGEEPWFHRIEVSRPEDLPESIRSKARKLSLQEAMDALPAATALQVSRCFLSEPLDESLVGGASALVLAQPLASVGFLTAEEARDLYADLVAELRILGYRAVLKPHPREPTFILPGVPALSAGFPIELWPYLSSRPFDLVIALRSTALSASAEGIARHALQLLSSADFTAEALPAVVPRLRTMLAAATDRIRRDN